MGKRKFRPVSINPLGNNNHKMCNLWKKYVILHQKVEKTLHTEFEGLLAFIQE